MPVEWDTPQNLRFQGQYLDRETGLHYNTFRYYDPAGGCYTQMDPIGLLGVLNTYTLWLIPWGGWIRWDWQENVLVDLIVWMKQQGLR